MALTLGVPLMDKDHEHLEALLLRAEKADGAELPGLFREIEAETRAHFRREEELMQAAGVPILHCHIGKHEEFLAVFEDAGKAAARNDLPAVRRFLCVRLPVMFNDHVGSVDRISSGFLQACEAC